MGEVKIRRAVPEDAEAIAMIISLGWIEVYQNDQLGLTHEYLSELRKVDDQKISETKKWLEKEDTTCWVAEVDGKVVGETSPHVNDKGENRVGTLYILKDYRRMGIGTMLMEKVYERFKGMGEVCLQCATYNKAAKNFYEKSGFKQSDPESVEEYKLKDGKSIPVFKMVKKV